MAYPTGTNWQIQDAVAGFQPIATVETSARHRVGSTCHAYGPSYGMGEFIYLPGVASCEAGSAAVYNSASFATALTSTTSKGPVAVAMAAIDSTSKYGWWCVGGSVPVKAATVLGNTYVYTTSTAGQLDDTGTGGSLTGAKFTSGDSGGFATVQLSRPAVPESIAAGASTTFTGVNTFSAAPLFTAGLKLDFTDSSGTPGAATANTQMGLAAIVGDSAATSVVITNSRVTDATTPVLVVGVGTSANLRTWNVQPAAGSFTVTVNAASAVAIKFFWVVLNKTA